MKKERFAVLDRDGTIIVDNPYSSDPDQIELIPGTERGLRQLRDLGLGLVVITNQSGIGRGFFGETALDLMHQKLCDLLEAAGIRLDGIYWCPHRPEVGCECRKPKTALLELAAQELDFDPRAAFVIGDKRSDIELGRRVGATTFLVNGGADSPPPTDRLAAPDYAVDNVAAAAKVIESLVHADGATAG